MATTRKPAAKKTSAKTIVKPAAFNTMVQGLVAQGIGYKEAVSTIYQGLREANGMPVRTYSNATATA